MSDLEQRIAKLRELDKARTQGKWKITIDSCATCEKNGTAEYCIYDIPSGNHGDYARKEDAQFIAAAPEMMQVIEEQDKQAKAMRKTMQKLVGALESLENKLLFCRQGHEADIIQQSIEDITSVLELAKPWVKS